MGRNEKREEKSSDLEVTKKGSSEKVVEEFLMMVEGASSGNDISKKLTEEHITQMIDQRGKVNELIHEDRKGGRFDNKFYFVGAGIFCLALVFIVLWKAPDYFPELLTFLVGFIGGGGGGYGFAKTKG